MWILEISLGGREILRQAVRGRSLLIGRSPSCDIVLRSPGIKPVHFLLEWIGDGEPIPGEGDWSLSDIHKEDVEAAEETASDESGMGVLLSKENVVLSGYSFKWVFDSLAETDLQKGVLSEKLRQARDGESDASFFFSDSQILEVVTVDTNRNKVTDIQHIKLQNFNRGYSTLPLEPNILFHTPMEARAHVDLAMIPEAKAFLRGYGIRHDDLKQTVLGPNDLLQIKWKMQDYYLRMVPEVKAPKAPIQFYRERFNIICAAALLALAILISVVNFTYKPVSSEEVVPPRIAQVSVREMRPLLPPPAEPAPLAPDIVPEPLPSEPVPVTSPQVKLKQAETLAPKPVQNPKPSVPAPKGAVTSMGLLGNLKASKEAPKVRADKMINQGLNADSAGGDDGFVVRQAPQGQLANREAHGTGLAAASSEVGGSQRGETNSFGAVNSEEAELPRLGARAERARQMREGAGGSGLTRDVVRQRIRDFQKDVRACYERALLTKPKIQGRIQYQWTITPQGRTTKLRLQSSQVGSPGLERCVQVVIQNITWPIAANGRPTNVNYPFEFQAKN